ncbi:hypothetical protein EV178_001767 [Coemansia sp. RSA 1646]|nr:hypothetical protein EV178_001767 [Coemansia sp. RSA 1646]KAJ1770919.1 hypothetical protein LPJ74_002815 [Coemansia sp. RSA 1843]KAJ2092920.1 hypothetical protein IW138_000633 [Coemansia sp. RSA 986]KAJ2216241.1 hypothetical protein EV179_001479 [Coemansia sp. RSA 487]
MDNTNKDGRMSDNSLLNIADDGNDRDMPELPSILQGKGYCRETEYQPQGHDRTNNAAHRKTFRVEPPSALLSRLQSFLPQIAEANKKLESEMTEDPSKLDIENVEDSSSQYIEMDLGLGVFDMKPKKDSEKADDIVINTRGSAYTSDSDSSDHERSDSESSSHLQQEFGSMGSKIIIDPASASTSSKRLGKKPHIEVLDSSRASNEDSNRTSEASEYDSDQAMCE